MLYYILCRAFDVAYAAGHGHLVDLDYFLKGVNNIRSFVLILS